MLTKEEYEQVVARQAKVKSEKVAMQVASADLKRFEKNSKLPTMIGDKKRIVSDQNGLNSTLGYEYIEEKCLISVTTIKKVVNGSDRVTRKFLYKFAVGLQMSLEEANSYFIRCGGELHDDSLEDYICKCALRDKDSIYDFVEEFERLTHSKIVR